MTRYTETELGDLVEKAMQTLHISFYDKLPKDTSDLSIHIYFLRHEHTIGRGKSVLIVNITKNSIDFKMRSNLNDYKSKTSTKSKCLIKTILTIINDVFKFISMTVGIVAMCV